MYLFSRDPSNSQAATWKPSISIDGRTIPMPPLPPPSSPPPPPPLLILAQTNLEESLHTLEIAFSPNQGDGYDDDRVPSHLFSHIVYTKEVDVDGQSSTRKFSDDGDVSNSGSRVEKGEETEDEKDLDSDFAGAAENRPKERMKMMVKRKWTRNMRRQDPPAPSPPTPTE